MGIYYDHIGAEDEADQEYAEWFERNWASKRLKEIDEFEKRSRKVVLQVGKSSIK